MREYISETANDLVQEMLSSIPCGLCVYRIDGNRLTPVLHNPAFFNMIGCSEDHFTPAEQIGNDLGVHPDDLPTFQAMVQETIHNGVTLCHTCRLWNEDRSEYRWIHIESTLKTRKDGSRFLYSFFTDVSEQQSLLNVIACTFELLAFINIESDCLTLYTRQAVLENLPPYTVESYSGSLGRLSNVYGSGKQDDAIEERFRVTTLLKRLDESPGGYDFVIPYHSDGHQQYKRINVLWGEKKRTICMVRADVTEMISSERRANEVLEHALETAEEASQAKSDFLSSMSHDIRTPMNAITGMTALAMAHLDEKERVKMYLDKIALSSRHLLSLVNDILDMNKIERSMIKLNRTLISMSELADQIADMISLQAEDLGVEFKIRTDGITHWYFYGDSLRINQILINILGNAIKFTPRGGKVDFTIKEKDVGKGSSKACYLFQVSDTGIGMSEEFLAHIFEPFSRGSNAMKVEGSGLGLSIAHGLVQLMGGNIDVSSYESRGSVFRIELEFDAAQDDGACSKPHPEADADYFNEKSLAGRHFLLAEDNAINGEVLVELLQMYGVSTALKTDGMQAVQEFRNSDPGTYDAILMDIQMPLMNGYEAARHIRNLDREDAKTIPIIAMTANAFEEDVQDALNAGMNAHISKPIEIRLLGSTLVKILNER